MVPSGTVFYVGRDEVMANYRLKSLLAFVAVLSVLLAAGLALWRYLRPDPMSTGVIHHAVCHARDWNRLIESSGAHVSPTDQVYTFDVKHPSDLFTNFSVRPVLWGTAEIPELLDEYGRLHMVMTGRYRTAGHQVDEVLMRSSTPGAISDRVFVSGAFKRERFSRRYSIALRAILMSSSPSGLRVYSTSSHDFDFHGSLDGNLIVFPIPIDDQLVHVIILDVSKDAMVSRP